MNERSSETMNENGAVRPMDVLFGRGANANNNPGNKVYRRLIKHKGALFQELIQVKRKRLAKSIVMAINSQGSRFMKFNKVTGKWVEAKDREARAKTMESLRKSKSRSNETEGVEGKTSNCEGFQDDCAGASSPANSCPRKSTSVPSCPIHAAAQPLKSTWLPVDTDMNSPVELVGQSPVMKSPAQKKENAKCSTTKVENAMCLKTKVGGYLYPFRSNEPETHLPHQVFSTSESCFPNNSQPTVSPHWSCCSSSQPTDHSLLNLLSADLSQRSQTDTIVFSNGLGTLWLPVPHEKEKSTICNDSADQSLEPLRIFRDENNGTRSQLHPRSSPWTQKQQEMDVVFPFPTQVLDVQCGFEGSEEILATSRNQGTFSGAHTTQDFHGAANPMCTVEENVSIVGVASGLSGTKRSRVEHSVGGTGNESFEDDWISRFDLDEQTEDLIVV